MLSPQNVGTREETFENMEVIYSAIHTSSFGNAFFIGTFHQLVAECSKIKMWKLCKEENHPYNSASFEMRKGIKLELHILKADSLQVSILCSKNVLKQDISQLVKFFEGPRYVLSTLMEKLGIAPADTFHTLCPYSEPTDVYPCLVSMTEYQHPTPNKFSYWTLKQKCELHQGMLRPTLIPSLLMLASGI